MRSPAGLIVVALPIVGSYELAILDGVREIATERRLEVLPMIGGFEAGLRALLREGEVMGAVADFLSTHWLEEFASAGTRFVQLAHMSCLAGMPNVGPDFREIGRSAARAFGSGRVLVFLGSAGHHASAEMLEGLREGGEVRSSLRATLLADFLESVPTPCGVLAASDRLACEAIGVLRRKGRRIPEDAAVIGVGDDRLEGIRAGIGLSSFALPGCEIGRAAVRAMFQDGTVNERLLARLHERDSSLTAADAVERACAHARRHFAESIGVSDLARVAGMSRRSFENAMLERHGISPGRFLQALRRDRALELLRGSDLPIHAVGAECGYPEPSVFTTAFRRWMAVSPLAYRQSNRSGQ